MLAELLLVHEHNARHFDEQVDEFFKDVLIDAKLALYRDELERAVWTAKLIHAYALKLRKDGKLSVETAWSKPTTLQIYLPIDPEQAEQLQTNSDFMAAVGKAIMDIYRHGGPFEVSSEDDAIPF